MAMVVLPPIDRRTIKRSELQAVFDSFSTAINTTKFQQEDFLPGTVVHRHLDRPVRIPLSAAFSGDQTTSNIGAVAQSGYYLISGSVLQIDVPHASLDNRYEEDQPVVHVQAQYRQVDGADTNPINRVVLATSTDSGVTWVPKTQTSRPCGATCGWAPAVFNGVQVHYLTGLAWTPPSEAFDRAVHLQASFGGSDYMTAPSTPAFWVGVMVNANALGLRGRFVGEIEASIRWLED